MPKIRKDDLISGIISEIAVFLTNKAVRCNARLLNTRPTIIVSSTVGPPYGILAHITCPDGDLVMRWTNGDQWSIPLADPESLDKLYAHIQHKCGWDRSTQRVSSRRSV